MPHSSPSSWDADPPLSSPTSPDSGARDSRSDGGSLLAPAPASLLSCCSPASVVSQQRWSRCADLTLYLSYAFILLIAAVSLYALITRREGLDTLAYALGLISLFLALPISLYDIHSHVANYVSPLQMRYIRILAMIPLYSVESWLALFFRQQRVGLELARELYEAFVIYNTFMLMVDFLGGADRTQALLRSHGVYAKHIFCLQRLGLKGWHVDNGEFYRRCFLCVLQYVLVRCLLAVLTAALSAGSRDLYCEGVWDWGACAYPHFTLLLTLSQFAAIYGLFLFRHELAVELQPIHPWPKLLCVKVIVFATFWLQAGLHIAQLVGGIRCVRTRVPLHTHNTHTRARTCWRSPPLPTAPFPHPPLHTGPLAPSLQRTSQLAWPTSACASCALAWLWGTTCALGSRSSGAWTRWCPRTPQSSPSQRWWLLCCPRPRTWWMCPWLW